MEILATSRTSTGDKIGYYMAIIKEHSKRKTYYATLSTETNKVLSIEKVYPSKKAAFTALGAR